MTLLFGIIGGLLLLCVAMLVWAVIMKHHHRAQALSDVSNETAMDRAVNPCNPHATRAKGSDAAMRNFMPTVGAANPSAASPSQSQSS